MVRAKKTAGAASDATPRKSSRISEAKRKATEEVSPASTKKIKAVVADKVAAVAAEEPVKQKKTKKAAAAAPAATPAKSKKTKKVVEEEDKENVEEEAAEEAAEEETEEVAVEDDDTTKALVSEIDGDDEDKEAGGASLFQPGQDVGKAPAAAVKKAAQIKAKKSASAAVTTTTQNGDDTQKYGGIVYVGRIPHGFFEHEMRSYFSQFGDIRRLRLSRNRKTGASKHYAFIEFADRDVADIVAKTMDNYLLFGHILRCSVVAAERIPPNLFKGANRRFKAVPWNLMSGRRMAQPKPESDWSGKISREAKRRASRAAQLEKALGYSFEAPAIKSVETVEAPAGAIEEAKAEEKLVEAAPVEAEPVPVAKGKKAKAKKVKA